MKHIVCFHLLNDFSGSPRSLSTVLKGLLDEGYTVDLVTSSGEGALNALKSDRLRLYQYTYQFNTNLLFTGINYFRVQLYTFFMALRYTFKRNVVFYVNTLLPVAPALAARITGKKVIYHYREHARVKGLIYRLLRGFMQIIAADIICISDYQRSFLQRKNKTHIIPNALATDLHNRLYESAPEQKDCKTVLMLSSLKLYKGVADFIKLAEKLPQYTFRIVINDNRKKINDFLKNQNIHPAQNTDILDSQGNIAPLYHDASLAVNLSNKKKFVETFGLTALEAMTAGLPVIVPTEGGIAELVEDGVNGYKIDVQDLVLIETCINKVLSNKELYRNLSINAKRKSQEYNVEKMIEKIITIIES